MASERDCVDHLLSVANNPSLSLPEVITLGLLVSRKWDRARAADPDAGALVTSAKAASFDSFTAAELAEFRAAAARMLLEHAASLPGRPVPHRERWSRGFWQGFASSWAYAISIALGLVVAKLMGSDVLTIARELLGPAK